MSGIYYDPSERRLRLVAGTAEPAWPLVTHNLAAPMHRCRRILRGWLPADEIDTIEWPEEMLRRSA
ncbi:MAG: hypothetical protein HY875_01075 [Chloroflexi bacterium]|nr:hypothetical protein [Chloroflexota bacterium]